MKLEPKNDRTAKDDKEGLYLGQRKLQLPFMEWYWLLMRVLKVCVAASIVPR